MLQVLANRKNKKQKMKKTKEGFAKNKTKKNVSYGTTLENKQKNVNNRIESITGVFRCYNKKNKNKQKSPFRFFIKSTRTSMLIQIRISH